MVAGAGMQCSRCVAAAVRFRPTMEQLSTVGAEMKSGTVGFYFLNRGEFSRGS
jgi:hypothetical protein